MKIYNKALDSQTLFTSLPLTKYTKCQKIERGLFMDPTKSFDHLDPKLKETYARVMGTDTSSSTNTAAPAQNPIASPTPTTPSLSANPTNTFPTAPTQPSALNQNPINTTPDLSLNPSPGILSSPTIDQSGLTPSISPASTTPPPLSTQPVTEQTPDVNAPSNASFFSNPSPMTTEPQQLQQSSSSDTSLGSPVEPPVSPTPVVPYTSSDTGVGQNGASTEPFAQPLPSPSSVGQEAPHETSALLKVIYIIGSVIFFAIYTIFWIKVFNLPFLF